MAELVAALPLLGIVKAAGQLVASLQQVDAIKRHNPVIAHEIEYFIKSLNDCIDLLRKQLPNKKSWALESLETDLNAVTRDLEYNLKKGSFRQFWDAKQIKEKLERLRQDLINKFQVKLFVTSLEVTVDADKKMDGKMNDFGARMVELSSNTAKSRAETVEIRKLLEPLVVGMKKQDDRIQSLVSIVRQNEAKVETSSETQKFLADVLASLQDLAVDEGPSSRPSSSRPTPAEDDYDDYLDPITAELIIDPVKCTDGETYDRSTVFKNNMTQQKQLVILCGDESMRKRLFRKFPDVERRFYSQRKSYRDEGLGLANTGHSAEALTMLKNVLQWAPNDNECRRKTDELQLVLEMSKLEENNLEKQKVVDMSRLEQKTVLDSNLFHVPDSDRFRVVVSNLENKKGSTIPQNGRENVYHTNVSCDECLMDPIKGPRFQSMVRHDYDLCLSCFDKRGRTKRDFKRLDLPSEVVEMSKLEKEKVVESKLEKQKIGSTIPQNGRGNVYHTNVSCDECLMDPIKGPRFQSMVRHDYDLCLSCFDKRGRTKRDFKRLDLPSEVVEMSKLEKEKVVESKLEKQKIGGIVPQNSTAEILRNVHHTNVTCDECLMNPIKGPRFKSTVRLDFDLCLSCFDKRGRTKRDFLRLDLPSGSTIPETTAERSTHAYHTNVTCNDCLTNPIEGPRFKSMERSNYNLCLTCFDKHGRTNRDKQGFLRLDLPSAEDSDEDSEEDSDEDSDEDLDESSDEYSDF